MRRVSAQSFYREIQKTDGNIIMGQIGIVLEDYNVRTFTLPRRYLVVNIDDETAQPGDVIIDGLRKYLLLDHAEKSDNRVRLFRMAEANKSVQWQRQTVEEDFVTGLPRATALQDMGMIDVAWEFIETAYDVNNKKSNSIRVLCGQQVATGDKLDGMIVHSVVPIQGVYWAECS